MKKLLLIIPIVLVLFACSKKSSIDVLPNYAVEYLAESKVTQQAKPKNDYFETVITDEFKKVIKEISSKSDQNSFLYPVGYNLYIGKNGKIEKVEKIEAIEIEPKGTYIYNNENLLMDDMTKKMLPIMEKWEFESAKLFNEDVGMQKNIKALFAIDNGEVIVKKPFDLSFDNFETEFFVAVEQMPSPIGGMYSIQKNIVYPEIAKRAGIEGRVFVKAFIDTAGNVVQAEIIRGIGAGCDEASIEAIRKVKFKPGMQRGKPVNTQVTVPILFKMDESKKAEDEVSSKNEIIRQELTDTQLGGLAKLEGKIVSAKDGSPIVAGNLFIEGTKIGCSTHHLGEFFVTKIPPGEHKIIFSHPEYGKIKIGKVKLSANKTLSVIIKVKKNT